MKFIFVLQDSLSSGKQSSSRGRARLLHDRARSSRPHGLAQVLYSKNLPFCPFFKIVLILMHFNRQVRFHAVCALKIAHVSYPGWPC